MFTGFYFLIIRLFLQLICLRACIPHSYQREKKRDNITAISDSHIKCFGPFCAWHEGAGKEGMFYIWPIVISTRARTQPSPSLPTIETHSTQCKYTPVTALIQIMVIETGLSKISILLKWNQVGAKIARNILPPNWIMKIKMRECGAWCVLCYDMSISSTG